MEKKDANVVLQRIKTYYPKFFYTGYAVENWFVELKEYDAEKIIEALRIYSESNAEPPNPINLKSIVDRLVGQEKVLRYKTTCKICGRILENDRLEVHENRCRSTKYMVKRYKDFFGKTLDKRELWELTKEEFDKRYDALLKIIYEKTNNPQEKQWLGHYFNELEEEPITLKLF